MESTSVFPVFFPHPTDFHGMTTNENKALYVSISEISITLLDHFRKTFQGFIYLEMSVGFHNAGGKIEGIQTGLS